MSATSRKAIFFDRDGTLLDELGYRSSPEGMQLLPGAAEAVRIAREAGFRAVLITNQSGVARGYFDEADLARVHERFEALLRAEGAALDGIFYCPHLPPETRSSDLERSGDQPHASPHRIVCACRKPAPGLYLEAARTLELDLSQSVTIGDSLRDLEAAKRAGMDRLFLTATGKGRDQHDAANEAQRADYRFVADARAAVTLALG